MHKKVINTFDDKLYLSLAEGIIFCERKYNHFAHLIFFLQDFREGLSFSKYPLSANHYFESA